MSVQSDLNSYPYQYILYYCNSPAGQNDPTVYQVDCSDVAVLSYDMSGDIQIDSWLLGSYSAPSNATLLSYSLLDVLSFYHSFYEIPVEIADDQHHKISSTDLAACRVDSSMIGYVVLNTTLGKQQYLNSSLNWVSMW
jgi:hypothetical protein